MKILQVMAGAAHGGAETAFVDMCIALADSGEQIEVATRANPARVERLEKAGLKVHVLPFGGLLDIYTNYGLRRIIQDFQPQIVQTWMSRAAQKTPKWQKSARVPRYLVVSRLGGYYKRGHFGSSDYFTTITPDIRRHLVAAGVPESSICHINNFAEVDEDSAPADRRALGTPSDALLLLAMGRLHKSKAFDMLMRAVKDVPSVHLWIAGEGPERAALEKLRTDLGLQDRVKLLGWRDDRSALFSASDICVFPSRYEPFGTVFVQAWAQKVPLLTTSSDGPRQYVRDGVDGLIVPVDDQAALADGIRRLAGDADLRQRLAEAGYKRYKDEFTKDKTVAAYLGFYYDILSREGLVSAA